MTIRKRKGVAPGFGLPPPYQPMTGEEAQLMVPGIFPYCAMMQIAAADVHCNYVVCRGWDPRDKRYYDYDGGDQPGIAVAKPYACRRPGVYRIGEVVPAVLPLSAGAEDDGKIVPFIGQNPGRVEGDACRGNPLDLTEEIVHILDEDDIYINWMLLEDGGRRFVEFELLEELEQWSGDIVEAAPRTWDPTANGGNGGFTVRCDTPIMVGDLAEIGHNAGIKGYGWGIMQETENEQWNGTHWVCVIHDLCCRGDEQGTCP